MILCQANLINLSGYILLLVFPCFNQWPTTIVSRVMVCAVVTGKVHIKDILLIMETYSAMTTFNIQKPWINKSMCFNGVVKENKHFSSNTR